MPVLITGGTGFVGPGATVVAVVPGALPSPGTVVAPSGVVVAPGEVLAVGSVAPTEVDDPIVEPVAARPGIGLKSFFVQGPDHVLIEIVESKPIPEGLWQ